MAWVMKGQSVKIWIKKSLNIWYLDDKIPRE